MRWGAAVVGVVALVCAAAARPVAPEPLYGIVGVPPDRVPQHAELTRLDRDTLLPVGKRLPLGEAIFLRTISPDGETIVFAEPDAGLLFVDAATLSRRGRLRVRGTLPGLGGWVGGRLVVLSSNDPGLVVRVVDAGRRRVLATRALTGWGIDVAWARSEAVVLLGSWDAVGPARLAVVDGVGRTRTVTLRRISAGFEEAHGAKERVRRWIQPAVAVDRDSTQAFVVGARRVAEVELASLRVVYHEVPRAGDGARKGAEDGSWRSAKWIEPDTLAIAGSALHGWIDSAGVGQSRIRPAGVQLVDTDTWTWRSIDPGASEMIPTPVGLLTTGVAWDSSKRRSEGAGLTGYNLAGTRSFHLFGRDLIAPPVVVGARAFVTSTEPRADYAIVDLARGTVVDRVESELPKVLAGSG